MIYLDFQFFIFTMKESEVIIIKMVAFERVDLLKIYQYLMKMITFYFLMFTIF